MESVWEKAKGQESGYTGNSSVVWTLALFNYPHITVLRNNCSTSNKKRKRKTFLSDPTGSGSKYQCSRAANRNFCTSALFSFVCSCIAFDYRAIIQNRGRTFSVLAATCQVTCLLWETASSVHVSDRTVLDTSVLPVAPPRTDCATGCGI